MYRLVQLTIQMFQFCATVVRVAILESPSSLAAKRRFDVAPSDEMSLDSVERQTETVGRRNGCVR